MSLPSKELATGLRRRFGALPTHVTMPYLEFDSQLRPLGPGVLTIGSGTEAAWRIHDRDLAPLHAVVTVERDGRAHVLRGAPYAEMFVNGRELSEEKAVLDFGDTLRLGTSAEFIYRQTQRRSGASEPEGYLRDVKRGRLYKLGPVIEIGRDLGCAVLLKDPEVSRHHAEVRLEGSKFVVHPVGNAYTLFNSDRLVGATPLKEGDELGVGRTILRFSTEPPQNIVAATGPHIVANEKKSGVLPTMYMNTVEESSRIREKELKRTALKVAVVLAMAIVALMLVTWAVRAM